jgi:hypothetical protein
MATTLNSNSTDTRYIEFCIRTALERGEISPVLEAQIKRLAIANALSEQEHKLLRILQDAIQDGSIRQVRLQ